VVYSGNNSVANAADTLQQKIIVFKKIILMNQHIELLANKAWGEFNNKVHEPYIVNPSCPILYFGNFPEYLKSSCKIVTVGLNPSDVEFTDNGNTSVDLRFRGSSETNMADYCNALNNYFEYNPYNKWFSSYENILNGLNASYYQCADKKNRALHTDICSCLATNPTWSKLNNEVKKELQTTGKALWSELILLLKPHIVLIAVPKGILDTLPLRDEIQNISPAQGITQYANLGKVDFEENYSPIIVVGRTRNMPFGAITKEDKKTIGKKILEHFYLTK
jgi:hypothetical protein